MYRNHLFSSPEKYLSIAFAHFFLKHFDLNFIPLLLAIAFEGMLM